MSQEEFAKAIQVSRKTVNSIETGKYNPSLELAFVIADFFNKTIEDVFVHERRINNEKSNLVLEIICAIFGLACLITAIMLDSENNSILCGFADAGLASGGLMIYKYFYWKSPKREKQYEEKIKQEKIEFNDELKEKVRDKSGRYAYIMG